MVRLNFQRCTVVVVVGDVHLVVDPGGVEGNAFHHRSSKNEMAQSAPPISRSKAKDQRREISSSVGNTIDLMARKTLISTSVRRWRRWCVPLHQWFSGVRRELSCVTTDICTVHMGLALPSSTVGTAVVESVIQMCASRS